MNNSLLGIKCSCGPWFHDMYSVQFDQSLMARNQFMQLWIWISYTKSEKNNRCLLIETHNRIYLTTQANKDTYEKLRVGFKAIVNIMNDLAIYTHFLWWWLKNDLSQQSILIYIWHILLRGHSQFTFTVFPTFLTTYAPLVYSRLHLANHLPTVNIYILNFMHMHYFYSPE